MTALQTARPLHARPEGVTDLNYAPLIRTHRCYVPNSAQMRQRTSSEREPSTVDDTRHAEQRAWCCTSC